MTKIEKYLGILAVFAVVLANGIAGFADESADFEFSSGEEVVEGVVDEAAAGDFEDVSLYEKQQSFLQRLKDELNLSKTEYNQVLNTISDTKNRLLDVSEEKLSLKEQLANLDEIIGKTTRKLIDVIRQVVEKENEITLLYEQIEVKEIALGYQKGLLKDYVRMIYAEENNYFTFDENGEIDAFKLLLADGNVSENLADLEYFDLLNEAGIQMVSELNRLGYELKQDQKDIGEKKKKLEALQAEIEAEKSQLELQKESKQRLLDMTMGQEEIYTQLLEQTEHEQEQVLNDVKNLRNAVAMIEAKIAEEGDSFNPDDYMALLDYRTQALYQFHLNTYGLGFDGFDWPVEPDLGISAYFHDPGYLSSFGVQHNAIDTPVYQGSPVRASADGVVYSTRENGYGYSYIILAHSGGFMTVYGHISEILVEEGQTVSQGAIIGLSGGMPGTIGAGYMTTGPHLHLEMLLNGLYVDPLDYLPLEVLTEEQVERLPEKYYDDWEEDVGRAEFVGIDR
ncbi:MAG: peptidoglycan DD-metalloendopeptidase family protein [Candidatus Peregrinibacteria bacterium]